MGSFKPKYNFGFFSWTNDGPFLKRLSMLLSETGLDFYNSLKVAKNGSSASVYNMNTFFLAFSKSTLEIILFNFYFENKLVLFWNCSLDYYNLVSKWIIGENDIVFLYFSKHTLEIICSIYNLKKMMTLLKLLFLVHSYFVRYCKISNSKNI